jgi:hypothetical protein
VWRIFFPVSQNTHKHIMFSLICNFVASHFEGNLIWRNIFNTISISQKKINKYLLGLFGDWHWLISLLLFFLLHIIYNYHFNFWLLKCQTDENYSLKPQLYFELVMACSTHQKIYHKINMKITKKIINFNPK